jgi:hypothetical protein
MVVVCGCFGYFFYFFTGVAGVGGVSRAVARMILHWRIRGFLCLYTTPCVLLGNIGVKNNF